MRFLAALVTILLSGCIHTNKTTESDTIFSRSTEYQNEIDIILEVDTENKKWEEIYLKEIATAQENDDRDAYKFFIVEYIKIPRMRLPEWMTKEPNYTHRKSASEVLRGQFIIEIQLKK